LIHCLERFQITVENGSPYTFSSLGIQKATGQPRRTVDVGIAELKRYKVLKDCGTIRFNMTQDKPTTVYSFVIDSFYIYLKEKAEVEMSITPNNDNSLVPIDTTAKTEEKAVVKAGVKATIALYKKNCTRKLVQEKEDNKESTSTGETNLNYLKEMEKTLSTDFYEKSVYPSIVPSSPAFNNNTKPRFKVPSGIDDKVRNREQVDRDHEFIEQTALQIVCKWSGDHVPMEIVNKRVEAFKVQVKDVHSVADVIRVLDSIAKEIK
jgi:hypothetical protein